MPNAINVVFWISLTGLAVLAGLEFRRARSIGRLFLWLALLGMCGAVYFLVFQPTLEIQAKGERPNQAGFIIVLYLFTVVGMACNYFYTLFSKPGRKRASFDLGNFLRPIFASPLVFAPLLGAFCNAEIDITKLTSAKMMVFFVAFENGFFWKEVVDNWRQRQDS